MSKGLLIGVVILILVVLAGGGYFWMQRSNDSMTNQTPSMTQNTPVMSASPDLMTPEASSSTSESTMSDIKSFTVEGSNFKFNPATLTVKKGDKVKITFKSMGGMHDFVIDDYDVQTKMLDNSLSETVEFTANKAGSFEYYCSVGNHRQMGMKGTLIVQ